MATALQCVTHKFCAGDLERVFAGCFARSHRTRLLGGAEEPLYQPAADSGDWNLLYYRQDFFASALHEISHWCIAGSERRRQVDFGYWYNPDGRNPEQQRAFEQVEVFPQALEYFFARACDYPFRVSVDNLDSPENCSKAFRDSIYQRSITLKSQGLPARGEQFYRALALSYGGPEEYRGLQLSADEFER